MQTRWLYPLLFMTVAGGFLAPFWPLCALGIALAAGTGRWIFAIAMGLLLDLAWGAPAGVLHFLYFPFAVFAILCVLGRVGLSYYLLPKSPQETL